MKIGMSCIVTPREWSFDEMLENITAAGYEAVEAVITDDGDITLDTPPAQLERLAERAENAGVEITSVCPSYREPVKDLMTNDRQTREKSIDNVKRSLDVTKGLGADTMLLTLGGLPPDLYYNQAYANALQSMHKLVPHAEQVNVNLAIEYVWNKFLLSPMEFARFCDECGSPKVGFFFDTGNMVAFGYPEHWARICGNHVMKVHFKDFQRPNEWKPLLEGDVNFGAVMTELRNIDYPGPVLSEVSPDIAPLAETAEAMRRIVEM